MKRDEKVLSIGRKDGYVDINTICMVFNWIYVNAYDRDKAINKIKELKQLGRIKYIEGTNPYHYEVIEQFYA